MKRGMLGVVAVAAIAVAILVFKQSARSPESRPLVATPAAPASRSVLLVADFSEAGTDDPCAEIIQLVRDAHAGGVPVQEIPSGEDSPLLRRYRVTVEPTVLVLDGTGRVLARHEGESRDTVAEIRADLEKVRANR